MTTNITLPITNLNECAATIRRIAVDHGWEESTRSFGEEVALWHSEASEALEEYRAGHSETEVYYGPEVCTVCNMSQSGHDAFVGGKTPMDGEEPDYRHYWSPTSKPEGIPIEAVDIIIRILHWAGRQGVDLDAALQIKAAYNVTRPFRHGNKVL